MTNIRDNKDNKFNNRKRLYIAFAAVIILAAAVLFIFYYVSVRHTAHTALLDEIAELRVSYSSYNEQKASLNNTINNLSADLGTKETMNQYYIDYKKKNDDLQSQVADLKSQSAELDEKITAKKAEIAAAESVKQEKKGKSYTIKANEIYSCPDKIPAGRYIVTGSGSFVIYTETGSVRAGENLDVAYNHSYTFDLKENEHIKSTAQITVTELK